MPIDLPPPQPAIVLPAPLRPTFALLAGLGNADWAHVGVDGHLDRYGLKLTVGSIGLANSGTLALRVHVVPAWPDAGPFVELGASVVSMNRQTLLTPTAMDGLGFIAAGWRFKWNRLFVDVALGPPPLSFSSSSEFTALAAGWPRLVGEVGYGF